MKEYVQHAELLMILLTIAEGHISQQYADIVIIRFNSAS